MQVDHAHRLWSANLISLPAIGLWRKRGPRDRLGEIANVDWLKISLGGNDREQRQPGHAGEAIGQRVLRPEDERGTDDGRLGEGLSNGRFAFALRPSVIRLRIGIGADRGNVHERPRACLVCRFSNVARALDVDALHGLAEDAAEIDHGGRSTDSAVNAGAVGDIRLDEPELANLAERLDHVGMARIPRGNPHSDATLEQGFAYVAADESTAAEHGDKLFGTLDHRLADSVCARRLTRQAARL